MNTDMEVQFEDIESHTKMSPCTNMHYIVSTAELTSLAQRCNVLVRPSTSLKYKPHACDLVCDSDK